MAPKKTARKKRAPAAALLSESSTSIIMDPVAASSPTREAHQDLTEAQILAITQARYAAIRSDILREFELFINKLEEELPDILAMDSEEFFESLTEIIEEENRCPQTSGNKSQSSIGGVHFNQPSVSGTILSNDNTSQDPKSMLKTPASSRLKPTPSIHKNKAINVKRLPVPGETAVSLAGSPLLICNPFGATENEQVALQITDPASGKIMALLKDPSSSCVEEINACLNIEAKTKIKDFAKFLNKISTKWEV